MRTSINQTLTSSTLAAGFKATRIKAVNAALATTLGAALIFSTSAHASEFNRDHSRQHTFTEYARVIDAKPIFKQVAYEQPREECWFEEQQHTTVYGAPARNRSHNNTRNGGQAVIGGLIGGVIGNQIGHHTGSRSGRIGATVAGAIIGSTIANESPRRHRRQQSSRQQKRVIETRPVKRCTTQVATHYEQKVTGYRVTYSFNGKHYTTRTKQHPGKRIPLRISFGPESR